MAELITDLKNRNMELQFRVNELEVENQRLTDLLDEGQSLAGDACSEPFTYAMSRLLGGWVNKVNAELYRQAGVSDEN